MMVIGMVLLRAMVLGTAMPVMIAEARGVRSVRAAVKRAEGCMLGGGGDKVGFFRSRVGGGVKAWELG